MSDLRTMPTAARWLIVVAVGAILAWAGVQALRGAKTGDDLLAARQNLRIWAGQSVLPTQSWASTWERLRVARDLEPGNPSTEEFLGLLAARRFDDFAKLQEATAHYVRSLTLRPISPNTWANLAEARYLVGDVSQVFQLALENAARLGPSNPQSQRVVAHYGLAAFDEINAPAKRAVEAMVAAGMRRDPAEMLAIVQRRGRLDVACRYLAETKRKMEPRWVQLCAQGVTRP